jgi:undecaprenyl-diphosphatase
MVDGYLAAVILGLVEGITEFLPISSTGHLIVAGSLLGFEGERAKTFEIFIQLGAILAIVWIYRSRFLELARTATQSEQSRRFIWKLAIAFSPAAIAGLIFHRQIKQYLFGPIPVAWALVVGGFVMLLIERLKPVSRVSAATEISPRQALGVGLAQVLSLFPGVSRSGATIMSGYALGLSRTAATEFSFFLSVPVMIAATGFDLLKSREALSLTDFPIFAIGFIVSFVSAVVVVRAFLRYIGHHSFTVFAWYRIAVGGLLLWWYLRHAAPGV